MDRFRATHTGRYRVVDTWNGGKGGSVVRFTSTATGAAGHNECFAWVHDHTPFSFIEATTRQGYDVEPVQVSCATCGEEGGGTGSMAGLVHRWGPTDHPFTPAEPRKAAEGGA